MGVPAQPEREFSLPLLFALSWPSVGWTRPTINPTHRQDGVRRCLGHEGGAFMNGISALIRVTENFLSLIVLWQLRVQPEEVFTRTRPCNTLILVC